MTGVTFAATYLDPPSGILYVARTPQKDNGAGWQTRAHFHRWFAADALRRARRNKAAGMDDATSVATIPAYLIRRLTQAAAVKDVTGASICPNILTDFQAMTGIEITPYG